MCRFLTRRRERVILRGEIPSPLNLPSGCVFQTRCPFVKAACKELTPVKQEAAPNHCVACHLYESGER
ncbi:hypothetical protein KM924_26710 [Brevibacillus parabrevis]|nr:hypothetical protein [Brevibacillus parabrevis]NRQ56339.1 hypothetical protein [Brevibacillus sp. HD1.4A]RNB97580.1 hypothetical protein EDM60_00090 [Brevibacillus parabrevis]